jgi:hypothetical protein
VARAEGLEDRDRRPHRSPAQIDPELEAAICRLRKDHPRSGDHGSLSDERGLDPSPDSWACPRAQAALDQSPIPDRLLGVQSIERVRGAGEVEIRSGRGSTGPMEWSGREWTLLEPTRGSAFIRPRLRMASPAPRSAPASRRREGTALTRLVGVVPAPTPWAARASPASLMTGWTWRTASRGRRAVRALVEEASQLGPDTRERDKLLQASYVGAMPLDLFRSEQERITWDLEAAQSFLSQQEDQFKETERTVTQAIELATNWGQAYGKASDQTSRLNQAFFDMFMIDFEGVAGALVSQGFRSVPSDDLVKRFEDIKPERLGTAEGAKRGLTARRRLPPGYSRASAREQRGLSLCGLGSSNGTLVGERGLEPPRGCPHRNLNPARLPIPPLARKGSDGSRARPWLRRHRRLPGCHLGRPEHPWI